MLEEAVQFDDTSRLSFSDQPIPKGAVLRALRASCESAGLDPVSELYNEALHFAAEGELGSATERLTILLSLAPEDAEARLLLAKTQVAAQKWEAALAALDEAERFGQAVPQDLRRAVEEHLRADQVAEDEQKQARLAREQGEIKALRQEARRLRSENAELVGRNGELERDRMKWATAAAGVSVLSIFFVLASLVLGGDTPTEAPVPEALVAEAPAVAPSAVEAPPEVVAPKPTPPAPPTTATVADRAAKALNAAPGLDGTALEVEVKAGSATVRGTVPTFKHRKEAEKVLAAVDGIKTVDASGVEVASRTRGTFHTVASGESLSKLAWRYYGDATQTKPILKANEALLKGKTDLQVGQKLAIPPVE